MAGIFISYRRADSDGWAGRLRDALRARFGDRVFRDVDNIPDGEIFSDVIDAALRECDVALVIIGPNWATSRDEHGRRLDQQDDWVRTETAMVLNRKIRVIPVLVGGAALPRAEDLPEELRSLTRRQAREIRSNSWDSDVALLAAQLKQILNQGRRRSVWIYAVPGVALAALGAFVGIHFFGTSEETPAEQSKAASSTASSLPEAPARTAKADVAGSEPTKQNAPAPPEPQKIKPPAEPPKEPGVSHAPAAATPPSKKSAPEKPVVTRPVTPKSEAPRVAAKEVPAAPRAERAAPEVAKAPVVSDAVTPAERPPTPAKVVPERPARVAVLSLPNRPSSSRELKIGDSWTYRLREMRFNRSLATVTHVIAGGDSAGIRELVRTGGSGGTDADGASGGSPTGTQRRLALEPRIFEQRIDRDATLFEFSPFLSGFSDLQPGVTWSRIAGASSSDAVNDWRFNGKVTGRERVGVPAGNFDAIKAELEGTLDISSPTTRNVASETNAAYQTYSIWFVPEVGRAVKYVRRTYNRARFLLDHEQYELVSYQLK